MVTCISDALSTMEQLLACLDDAYWEASTIERKDLLYDIISAINQEQSELAKLSIQDHSLDYEPVTPAFRIARNKLNNLRKMMDTCVVRSATATRLEPLIGDIVGLITH